MTVRIANCSGFLGDRLSGPREMVDGGAIDYLTGDWLAELTMSILTRQRDRDPGKGFPGTFISQMSGVLASCATRGIRIIANAGGVNPHACAAALREVVDAQGLDIVIAVVDGDDITEDFTRNIASGDWAGSHLTSGQPFSSLGETPTVVSAYLGAWGIVEALDAGATLVVTGRVSDASPIVAAAAHHYGWGRADLDRIAGAVAAGHVIECSAQATGGNFSFFTEIDDLTHPGFPVAEIEEDGSAIITKHRGTGGAVSTETVLSQLLYEIDGPRYANPDVIARFDTVSVDQVGEDRVRVSGAIGESVPSQLKAGAVCNIGWSAAMSVAVTGLNRDAKVDLLLSQVWSQFPEGRETFDDVVVTVTGGLEDASRNPRNLDDATALLRIAVAGRDKTLVNRFPRVVVEQLLGGFPGMALPTPPTKAGLRQQFWPTLVPTEQVPERVTIGDRQWFVNHVPVDAQVDLPLPEVGGGSNDVSEAEVATLVKAPLGRIAGARSGDKGGNSTLGLWARTDEAFDYLRQWWTAEHVAELLGATEDREFQLWAMPHLRSVGVTVVGWLGEGAASNLRIDPHGKGLGEYVRSRHIPVPEDLLSAADQSA